MLASALNYFAEVHNGEIFRALKVLMPHLAHLEPTARPIARPDNVVDAVVAALFGPNKTRARGWSASAENAKSIRTLVSRCVEQGVPIYGTSYGGGAKLYGLSKGMGVDLSELLWFERFANINNRVREVYESGIYVDVLLEDLGEQVLACETVQHLGKRLDVYAQELRTLAGIVGPSFINVVRESELCRTRSTPTILPEICTGGEKMVSPSVFVRTSVMLAGLFKEYLTESEMRGVVPNSERDRRFEELGSYRALVAFGWIGGIPKIQRSTYYTRAQNACKVQLSAEEGRRQVANYLGCALTRKVIGLIRSRHEDESGAIPPLKFSFVQVPPGTSRSLERERIEYVACDRSRKSGRKTAPWTGYGAIRLDARRPKPTILCPSELQALAHYEKFSLPIVGPNGRLNLPVVVFRR